LREEAQKPPVNEGDVVDYLREGAFPQQVVSRFGLTIDQVNAIARKHGIVKEDDAVEIEPVKTGEQEQEQEKTLAERCAELSAEGKNPSQIAGLVSKEFKRPIKTGDVVGLLSESVKTSA
jgi:superfamily II helicase